MSNYLNTMKDTQAWIDQFATIEIPRHVGFFHTSSELHIFCDASDQGYAACAYVVNGNGSNLLFSKNRVAPTKRLTTPRLELMGAQLAAQML